MYLLYFSWVREKIGKDGERVTLPPSVDTVAMLLEWLKGRSEGHAEALADTTRLRVAVDQKFVGLDAKLGDAREIAIFPPVTGG